MIFLAGNYGFDALGDEAILAATVARLRASRPEWRVMAASGKPADTTAAHGIEAVAWNDLPALHRAVSAAGAVVVGGGELFQDGQGVDPGTFLTGRHSGLPAYAGAALLAALYRKPLMLCAVGVGPLVSSHGMHLTRMAARMARILTVRDQGSKAALEELGIPADRIQVTADLAFAGPLSPSSPLAARRPVLGVVPRQDVAGIHPDFLIRELAAALDLFLEHNGGTVVLVPLAGDGPVASRVLEQMRLRRHAGVSHPATPGQAYASLQACDLVLGMRYHALVLAALAGVPAVALGSHGGIGELAASLALDELSFDVKNLRAPRLAARLAEALRCRDLLARPLPFAVEDLRQAAESNISRICELMDCPPAETELCPEDYELLVRSLAAHAQQPPDPVRKPPDHSAETALRAKLQQAIEERAAAGRACDDYAARLHAADHDRAAVVVEIDRYAALFRNNLVTYRSQRAWKMMLVLRKAYTLLVRSKSRFLTWALGIPFGRVGPLEEYELTFPDIGDYVPDTFRQPFFNSAPAAGTAAVVPAAAADPPAPDTPLPRDRYDVVILAIIDFDFRFQRPQQIAAEFARQGHRVLWISPTRFLPPSSPEPYQIVPLREGLWEVHLRSRQPDIYLGELLPTDVSQMSEALAALYRDWSIAEHTVFVQLPFWRRLALDLRDSYGSCLLYDCMDDWETFENMGSFNVSEEKHLVRECDVLIVTGAELDRKFRAQGLHPVLARNGADYPFFAKARPNALLDGLARPVVGYFGAIADWIDLDLVYQVAKNRPQYSFVLIGQVFGRDTSLLEALPNVRLLGNKPYADIPAYLHNFDACTIPFLINQVTKATDPVKLYEYFSLGKPVVATNMAELAQCGDLLYIGHDPDDFAAKLDLAVSEKDPNLPRRRTGFAQANTWSSRVADIDGAVRQSFPLVSILVVTHNSAPFVRPCFDSILRNTAYPSYEVLLVDNASTDDTPALLEEYAGRDPRFRLALLPENLGFAAGNNQAARQACGQHLIFLNVDTMVTSGWIDRLLRHLRQDPSIGLLCPVTNFAGNEVKINVSYTGWQSMERFARALAATKSGERFEIGVAPLYCALMPRSVWERVGEMDARYEIGMFEDDDLSLRVRQAGFGVFAAEDCFIHHFGQGSFAKLPSETYNRIFEANRQRFEEKWKRPWVAHRPRSGVRPAFEETRFDPVRFLAG